MNRNDFNVLRDKFAIVDQIHDILTAQASSGKPKITIEFDPVIRFGSNPDTSMDVKRKYTLTPAMTEQIFAILKDVKKTTEKELKAIILSAKDNPELEPEPELTPEDPAESEEGPE